MKASDITAMVTGDDDSMERITVGSIPIGFGYSKFRLSPEGLVAEQVILTPPSKFHFTYFLYSLSKQQNF